MSAYTSANTPGEPSYSARTTTTLTLANDANSNPSGTEFAIRVNDSTDTNWDGKYVNAQGDPSDTAIWMTDDAIDGIVMDGLLENTTYTMDVKARNQDDDETAFGSTAGLVTDVSGGGSASGIIRIMGGILQGVRFGGN
jgi:hypothetical protein